MRKRSHHAFICAVLSVLCTASFWMGCARKDETLSEQERINAALKRSGLSGIISESESYPENGGTRHQYVIRSETENYEGTDNPLLVADVVLADDEDGQMLLAVFHQSGVWEDSSRRIKWEDWKKQFEFVALMQGGFEKEDEIYRAFCDEEMPDGMEQVKLEAELSNGWYCTVALSCMSQKAYDDRGFEGRRYSATMRINIFGSFEQYFKRRIEQEQSMP